MIVTALAALSVAVWVWFVSSTFVPVTRPEQPVEYVFVGARGWLPIAAALAAMILLVPVTRRRGDAAKPLWLLACAPLAALALIPGAAPRLSPLLYLLVDLRPWWTAAVVAWVAYRAGFRFSLPNVSVQTASITLFVLLAAWATATTPHLRFDAALQGDEPKYLRFCENWYQGKGLEVGNVQTMAELGAGYWPPLWRNALAFGRGVSQDTRYAFSDLRTLFTDGLRARYNRAEYAQAFIVRGRNGGYYQVHTPGLSVLLFPAYALDRVAIARSAGHQGVFPDRLPLTNLTVLLLWAGWGVALFALLRVVIENDITAWVVSALTMMTMPMAAFGFQIYPEASAGIIVCGVLAWVLRGASTEDRTRVAVAVGAAAGFLPWLNVRFLIVSVVLVCWAVLRARRRGAVLIGFGIAIAALCVYAYHITGSLRPDAMYSVEGAESPWTLAAAGQSIVSLPFDRIWGLLPHAPVYLLALPGWVVLARRSRALAVGLALLIAALAIPVAGYGFTAAGSTPMHQLAAVIPLIAIPVWAAVASGRGISAVLAMTTTLLVLSLDTALSYNRNHYKEIGRHIDAGFSGWAPNLLFPWTHGNAWIEHPGTFALFLVWASIAVALFLAPMVLHGVSISRHAEARRVLVRVLLFVGFAFVATMLGGEWTRSDYLLSPRDAHDIIVRAAVRQEQCLICVSSTRGLLGRSTVVPAGDQQFAVNLLDAAPRANEEARMLVRTWTEDGIGWGTIAADFGDGTTTGTNIAGDTELRHRYAAPGTYRLTIRFEPATGTPKQQTIEVAVR